MSHGQRRGVKIAARGLKRDLNVRANGARMASNEGGRLEHIARQRPASREHIFGEVPQGTRQGAPRQSIRGGIAHLQRNRHRRVVVIVGADAGEVRLDGNAQRLQMLRGPHAGEHQQLRRVNRAGTQQHLARRAHLARSAGGSDVDAGGAASLDANAGDGSTAEHSEIRARKGRHQHGARAGIAAAAMNRALAQPVAFRIKSGEIFAVSKTADRRKGIGKRLIQAIGFRNEGHVNGPVDAVHGDIAPVGIVFRQAKIRQYLLPAPAGIAGRSPIVVVRRVAAVIGHAVDGTRAADDLAARQRNATVVERGLGFGAQAPGEPAMHDGRAHQRRHLDEGVACRSAGFDQADPRVEGLPTDARQVHIRRCLRQQ